jgi:hypothetical protein
VPTTKSKYKEHLFPGFEGIRFLSWKMLRRLFTNSPPPPHNNQTSAWNSQLSCLLINRKCKFFFRCLERNYRFDVCTVTTGLILKTNKCQSELCVSFFYLQSSSLCRANTFQIHFRNCKDRMQWLRITHFISRAWLRTKLSSVVLLVSHLEAELCHEYRNHPVTNAH